MACETEKLAFDIIYYNLGKRSPSQNDDDVVKCLRQCVSQMLENHSIIFNRIISRIDLHQNTGNFHIQGCRSQLEWVPMHPLRFFNGCLS